jgi:hypothetical protein
MLRIKLVTFLLFFCESVYTQSTNSQEITVTEAELLLHNSLNRFKNYAIDKKGYIEVKPEIKQIGKAVTYSFVKNNYKITLLVENDSVSNICWTEKKESYSFFLNEANALGYVAANTDGSAMKKIYTNRTLFIPSFQTINMSTFIVCMGDSKGTK